MASRAAGRHGGRPRLIYERGEDTASRQSPVRMARLLAHGRVLLRTGNRKGAVERLRQANDLYLARRGEPFIARTEKELAECHLPANPAKGQSVFTLTSREKEVARLIGKGLSNPEVAWSLAESSTRRMSGSSRAPN